MADIEKPITRFEYFVITTDKFPSYEKDIKYKRYLRRSINTPTLVSGEEKVTVAITTYPNNPPYDLNTDPIDLSGWDPTEKTWGSCQDWLFYDDELAQDYEDPNGMVDDAKIGGFMKLEPTYFYYDSENKYQGSGTWNNKNTNNAVLTPPLKNGSIADPNQYDITWNGINDWIIDERSEPLIPPQGFNPVNNGKNYYYIDPITNKLNFYTTESQGGNPSETLLSDYVSKIVTQDNLSVYYFYSTTSYNTAAKTATSPQSNTDFTLVNNTCYLVYMQGGNGGGATAARTMNLNNTGAVPMYLGEHVAAITGQFQMDSGLYIFVYHAASEDVGEYFQVRPVVYRTLCAYQLQGNSITVDNTQYSFNKNFSFELTCQTDTTNTVTLNNWAGRSVTATCVVNGNTTSGIPNGYKGIAFFYYDATNGHKLYIASDFINIYGLAVGLQSTTSNNHGTIPIQLRNTLATWGGQYRDATHNRYGLNLGNSDIIGVNGFYTQDLAGGYSEGINFYRSASTVDNVTHYYNDSIYANAGHFYFGANVERVDTKGSETTGTQNSDAILHASELVGIAKSAGIYVLTATDDYAAAKTLTFVSGNDKLKARYTYTFYIPHANKCFSQPTVTYNSTTYNIVTNRVETGYPNYNNYARAFGHGVYAAYIVSTTIYLIRITNEPLFSILINPSNGSTGCCVTSLDFENGEVFDLYCDGVTLGAGTIYYSTSSTNNATDAIYYNDSLLQPSTTIKRGYYKAKILSDKLYFYDQDKWTYDEIVEGTFTYVQGTPTYLTDMQADQNYTYFISLQLQDTLSYTYTGSLLVRYQLGLGRVVLSSDGGPNTMTVSITADPGTHTIAFLPYNIPNNTVVNYYIKKSRN